VLVQTTVLDWYIIMHRNSVLEMPIRGGPPERIDFSMAKTLARTVVPMDTLDFNRCPPHFSAAFIKTIDFEKITAPCYRHLKPNVVALLPLLFGTIGSPLPQASRYCHTFNR